MIEDEALTQIIYARRKAELDSDVPALLQVVREAEDVYAHARRGGEDYLVAWKFIEKLRSAIKALPEHLRKE